MGDQKDHMTIQKKDVETAESQVESPDYDVATEALPPPALQLKADETSEKEEGAEKEQESSGPFQFAMDAPPQDPEGTGSKIFEADPIQGKGIAEPFKAPIVQKKDAPNVERDMDKPSFTL